MYTRHAAPNAGIIIMSSHMNTTHRTYDQHAPFFLVVSINRVIVGAINRVKILRCIELFLYIKS